MLPNLESLSSWSAHRTVPVVGFSGVLGLICHLVLEPQNFSLSRAGRSPHCRAGWGSPWVASRITRELFTLLVDHILKASRDKSPHPK